MKRFISSKILDIRHIGDKRASLGVFITYENYGNGKWELYLLVNLITLHISLGKLV